MMLSMVESTDCAMALGNLSDNDGWKISPHLSPGETQVSTKGSKHTMKSVVFQHKAKNVTQNMKHILCTPR